MNTPLKNRFMSVLVTVLFALSYLVASQSLSTTIIEIGTGDVGGDGLSLGRVAVDDHDVRAVGREAAARCFAHPRRRAGDQGRCVVE